MYRAGLPINQPTTDESGYYGNFDNEFRNFWTNGSYYAIFAGLGHRPGTALPALSYKPESIRAAESLFDQVRRDGEALVDTLPTNYEYLRELHGA
jgi:tryptophan 6-halogenase